MNINLTLIGQSITFAVFVWFCYAYVWPPLVNALTERKKKIADGLAAAEKGQEDIKLAEKKAAKEAVKHVEDGFIIGLGSGSTVAYAIKELGEKIEKENHTMHIFSL